METLERAGVVVLKNGVTRFRRLKDGSPYRWVETYVTPGPRLPRLFVDDKENAPVGLVLAPAVHFLRDRGWFARLSEETLCARLRALGLFDYRYDLIRGEIVYLHRKAAAAEGVSAEQYRDLVRVLEEEGFLLRDSAVPQGRMKAVAYRAGRDLVNLLSIGDKAWSVERKAAAAARQEAEAAERTAAEVEKKAEERPILSVNSTGLQFDERGLPVLCAAETSEIKSDSVVARLKERARAEKAAATETSPINHPE